MAQQLAPHEVEAVQRQVAELKAAGLSAPPTSASYVPPVNIAPVPYANDINARQQILPQNIPQVSAPAASPPVQVQPRQPDILSLNSNRLADILASAKAQQAPRTSTATSTPVPYNQPPVIPVPASTSEGEPSALLAKLRAAGILGPEGSTPVNGALAPPPSQYPPPQLLGNTSPLPPAKLAHHSRIAAQNDVELTSASLKK